MHTHIRSSILFAFLVVFALSVSPAMSSDEGLDEYLNSTEERVVSEETMMIMLAEVLPSKEPERFPIDNPPERENENVEPSTRVLPFWGDKAREQGYELPLPFGLAINGLVQRVVPEIKDLKFGFGSAESRPGIDIKGSEVTSATVIGRADMWLFPFLNLYGFGGIIRGHADIQVNVAGFDSDGDTTEPFRLNIDSNYTGYTGGLGATLAGGYKQYFASLDTNHAKTKLDFLDGELSVTTITPRVGIRLDSEKQGKGAFWVGVMYMDFVERLHGSVEVDLVGPGTRTFEYDLKFTTDNPYSYLAGGTWEFSKKMQAMVEVSLGGRKSLLGSFMYRF